MPVSRRPAAPWIAFALTILAQATVFAVVFGVGALTAHGQVQLELTASPGQVLGPHLGFGGEQLRVAGISRDGLDDVLVAWTPPMAGGCPTGDPIRVYRRRGDEPWVFEQGLDPLDGRMPTDVALDGDILVVGDGPGFAPHAGRVLVYRRWTISWDLVAELEASESAPWDLYGNQVAVHGDLIAVGAENKDSDSTTGFFVEGPGAVFLYKRSGPETWDEYQIVRYHSLENGDRFGAAIDVRDRPEGAQVLVGAPGHTAFYASVRGTAFTIEEDNDWNASSIIALDDPDESGYGSQVAIGESVIAVAGTRTLTLHKGGTGVTGTREAEVAILGGAIDRLDAEGDLVAIGEPTATDIGADGGRVRVFRRLGDWTWEGLTLPGVPHHEAGDRVGTTVAIGAGQVAVGAPGDDDAGPEAGVALVFDPLAHEQGMERVVPGPASPDGAMGVSIAVGGDLLAAGLPGAIACAGAGVPGDDGGVTVVYRREGLGWRRIANLSEFDVDANAAYGAAVAVAPAGDVIAVGAPQDGADDRGTVHVYESGLDGWARVATLPVPAAWSRPDAGFGAALAFSADGQQLWAGAPRAGGGGTGTPARGQVFRFDRGAGGVDGWTYHSPRQVPSELSADAAFGTSIVLVGGRVVVGAPGHDAERGVFVVYDGTGPLVPASAVCAMAGGQPGDRLGAALAAESSRVYAGVPGRDDAAGAVVTFEDTGGSWVEAGALPLSSSGAALAPGMRHGASVARGERVLLVGAPGDPLRGDVGSIVVLHDLEDGRGWQPVATLDHPAATAGAGLGTAVVMVGDQVLAGSPGDDHRAPDGGAIHAIDLVLDLVVPACPGPLSPFPVHEVIADDVRPLSQQLGHAVDVSDGAAIVGIPYADVEHENAIGQPVVAAAGGTALVMRRRGPSDWAVEADLNDLIGVAPTVGWFGSSVAIEGHRAAVGGPTAQGSGVHTGAVVIFERDPLVPTWTRAAQLQAPATFHDPRFGAALDLDGDQLVVGAPFARPIDVDQVPTGAGWYFEQQGPRRWERVGPFIPLQAEFADRWGAACAIDGDWLALGGPEADTGGLSSSGAVCLWRRGPDGIWREHQRLRAPVLSTLDRFGWSVALEGDVLVVGAPYADTPAANGTGTVHVFRLDPGSGRWVHEQELATTAATGSDGIGRSVDIDGDTIVVGGIGFAPGGTSSTGGALVWNRSPFSGAWVERAAFTGTNAQPIDWWGQAVAIDGGNVWVGAPQADLDPLGPPDAGVGRAATFDLHCGTPCPADIAEPAGVVDFADLVQFLQWMSVGDPRADLAPAGAPDGVVDFQDLIAFLADYAAGC